MKLCTMARARVIAIVGTALLLATTAGIAAADNTNANPNANPNGKANAKGRAVYEQLCVSCHGKYGRGDGPMAPDLTARPPDFTRPELLAGRTDAQVVAQITGGSEHTPMAIARVMKPESLRAAIAYMRTLSVPGKHVSVLAGKDIYENFCWYCHGIKGDGNGPVAKNVEGTKPRNFTDKSFVIDGREGEIFQTITMGAAASFHGNATMLEWGNKLTDQQRRDVIEYIKVLKAQAH